MVRIMRADIRNGWRQHFQLLLVRGLHKLLQIRHHLVELLDRVTPLLVVEFYKDLIIVSAEFVRRPSLELHNDTSAVRQSDLPPAAASWLAPR